MTSVTISKIPATRKYSVRWDDGILEEFRDSVVNLYEYDNLHESIKKTVGGLVTMSSMGGYEIMSVHYAHKDSDFSSVLIIGSPGEINPRVAYFEKSERIVVVYDTNVSITSSLQEKIKRGVDKMKLSDTEKESLMSSMKKDWAGV